MAKKRKLEESLRSASIGIASSVSTLWRCVVGRRHAHLWAGGWRIWAAAGAARSWGEAEGCGGGGGSSLPFRRQEVAAGGEEQVAAIAAGAPRLRASAGPAVREGLHLRGEFGVYCAPYVVEAQGEAVQGEVRADWQADALGDHTRQRKVAPEAAHHASTARASVVFCVSASKAAQEGGQMVGVGEHKEMSEDRPEPGEWASFRPEEASLMALARDA